MSKAEQPGGEQRRRSSRSGTLRGLAVVAGLSIFGVGCAGDNPSGSAQSDGFAVNRASEAASYYSSGERNNLIQETVQVYGAQIGTAIASRRLGAFDFSVEDQQGNKTWASKVPTLEGWGWLQTVRADNNASVYVRRLADGEFDFDSGVQGLNFAPDGQPVINFSSPLVNVVSSPNETNIAPSYGWGVTVTYDGVSSSTLGLVETSGEMGARRLDDTAMTLLQLDTQNVSGVTQNVYAAFQN
jgi:hypothetical protein